ncbi:MAG: phosphate ABC transporter ATP-binding protein [Rhodoferax sp.]|nr:phosphate ABC transporter ATP-binding protein [Rhodoferax sp.]
MRALDAAPGEVATPLFALQTLDVQFGARQRGVRALCGVNLSIHAGERVALVGANGCGKSTLLRVLHGLIVPTQGRLSGPARGAQAMLFQKPYLMRMPVLANVALGLWLRGTPWAQAKVQALEALGRVGLADLAARNAHALSGGQQQRVALARAWALNPQVLLLDEPTASLDPHAKREVEALMHEFALQRRAMTLIFASHNLGQVKRLASRVIYLEQGQVLADLPVPDFFDEALLQQRYPQAHLFVKGETL